MPGCAILGHRDRAGETARRQGGRLIQTEEPTQIPGQRAFWAQNGPFAALQKEFALSIVPALFTRVRG